MANNLSDSLITLLADADKRHGLPNGTMHAIMQQETGGNDKYLKDPTTYHYNLNAEGKRIAGHTGKVSTAFGPFGILESTAADPGFGVKPLKDKTSLVDQLDFAAAYVSKRGLGNYGEGQPYAKQVNARIGKQAPVAAVVAPQSTQAITPQNVPEVQYEAPVVLAQAPVGDTVDPNMAWNGFKEAVPQGIQVADLSYGSSSIPQFTQDPSVRQVMPNFQAFGKWKGRA